MEGRGSGGVGLVVSALVIIPEGSMQVRSTVRAMVISCD